MNTAGNPSPDPNLNLFANLINMPDKEKWVFEQFNGMGLMELLQKILSKQAAKETVSQAEAFYGQFSKPIIGSPFVVKITQGTSQVLAGNLLKVTLQDTVSDVFRKQNLVNDGSPVTNLQGRVVAHGAGYFVLEPTNDTYVWTTADFPAGTIATVIGNTSGVGESEPMESQYYTPLYVSNQTSPFRENVRLSADQTGKTWAYTSDGKYWFYYQQYGMMQRIPMLKDLKYIFSKYNTFNGSSLPGGVVPYSMGFIDAIQDPLRNGIYNLNTSLMTKNTFETWMNQLADRTSNQSFTLVVGRGFLNTIQNFTTQYIKFVGKNNTFGGETVKGLDVRNYSINGWDTNIIMANSLNNQDQFQTRSSLYPNFTQMQMMAIALDSGTYTAAGGGNKVLPSIEKRYFGPKPEQWYYVPGIGGATLMGQGGDGFTNDTAFNLAVRETPTNALGYYCNDCMDFMTYRMALNLSI